MAAADRKFESVVRTGMTCSAFAVVIVDRLGNSKTAAEGSHCTVVAVLAGGLRCAYQDSRLGSDRRCDTEIEVETSDCNQNRFEHRRQKAASHSPYRSPQLHHARDGRLGEW